MNNVIEMFPGLKELEMKRFRSNNFRPGLVDFRAIDPSKEVDKQAQQKVEINVEMWSDNELRTLSKVLEDVDIKNNIENSNLSLYNNRGIPYNLYIKSKSTNI